MTNDLQPLPAVPPRQPPASQIPFPPEEWTGADLRIITEYAVAYAAEAVRLARIQALEDAARVCDQRLAVVNDEGTDAEKFTAAYLAAAIRALPPLE